MRPAGSQVHHPVDELGLQGFGATRSVAVPAIGTILALGGAFIGGAIGSVLVGAEVIQPGTSVKMGPAVVGVLGGGIAWLVSVLVCMAVFRNDGTPSREETVVLVIAAVGFLVAGWFLATTMPAFEDAWKDPRMFRLQRLIWLDAGLAVSTCLVMAQRHLRPPWSIVLMTVIGPAFLAALIRQFMPFLDECAPVRAGSCRIGF
jgi:hypothetical protein